MVISMFERKILNSINKWKESLKIKKKALIIKGLRQIGKTTIVQEYCNANYENVIYINFMNNNLIKQIFDGDLIVPRIIRDLSALLPNVRFIPNKTVLIFDELQECANARSSIKPFMLDGSYDIIATGSLLGLRGYNKKRSKGIPTGFEYVLTMKPMDFEEFLWAKGINKDLINYVKECFINKEKISDTTNNSLMNYFREYLCVGGMPDVVDTFIRTSDLNQVYDIQTNLLEQYKDDFGKHLDENENEYYNQKELIKIMEIYNSIPSQIAKENKKFQYSVVNKYAKSREYKNAITWLEEFGLIKLCHNLTSLDTPLNAYKDEDYFKIYVADTGLFIAMLERGTTFNILNKNLGIYKGAIYENIVADAFIKLNKNLYYYTKSSGLEIDFITMFNNKLTPIEVKSTNGNAKSLKTILTDDKYNVEFAIKLIDGNIGYANNILTIPLYLAFLINEEV